VCLHFAFAKTILFSPANYIASVINGIGKFSLPQSVVLPDVFLTSISSRAPPTLNTH
jgi:hypothetical protein